jgi:hypothetical protein
MTTCKTCGYREGAPVSFEGQCYGAPPSVVIIDGEQMLVRPIMQADDRACAAYRIAEILTGGHDVRTKQ